MSLPNRIARLNIDGSQDTSFAAGPGLNDTGHCVTVLRDGRMIVGGAFGAVQGAPRARVAVVNADGTVHPARIDANWDVYATAEQTDGKILVVGRFTQLDGIPRERIARLGQGYTVEPAFDPTANGTVRCMVVTPDGKIYAGGAFTGMGDRARDRLVRLINDPADSTLTVHSSSRVSWLRGGSGPESSRVQWDVDTGSGYVPLTGAVLRLPGGWEITGLALSGAGTVRARVFPGDSHSSGVMEAVRAYEFSPEIAITVDGASVASGGTVSFGTLQNGSVQQRSVQIRNAGLAPLTITLPVALTGTAAASYSITQAPLASVAPGTSTNCVIRLTPTTEGSKPAVLTILSNDADEATYTINLAANITAGPGGVDASWQPTVNGAVRTLAMAEEAIVIAGGFSAVSGVSSNRYARLSTTAIVPQWLGAVSSQLLTCVLPLPSGQWLLAGTTMTIKGVTRRGLARLNADGSLDASFNPTISGGSVQAVAVDATGNVYVGGYFVTGGVGKGLIRLTSVGGIDSSYAPQIEGQVNHLAMTADGKLLVTGTFVIVASQTRPGMVRLLQTGGLDPTFVYDGWALTPWPEVSSAHETTGGKIIITQFRSGLHALRRLLPSGADDPDFTESSLIIWAVALQADGRILVAGLNFDTGAVILRRHHENGLEDATFVSAPSARVRPNALSLDAAGRVYVMQEAAPQLLRLINGAATASLTVPTADTVRWLRGGCAPEAQSVRFELSQNAGLTWIPLGAGTRITGGWQLSGLSLPRSGRVRGRAATLAGLHDVVTVYADLPVPDMDIEYPEGTAKAVGATLDFGALLPRIGTGAGQTVDLTLTLRNTGAAPLTGLSATVTGDWAVTSLGLVTVPAGQSTTLVVRFAPTAIGTRTGTLTVNSNLSGAKSPYTLSLTGAGIALPTATTLTAAAVISTQAQLRGSVKPNHPSATTWIEYKRVASSVWLRTPDVVTSGFAAIPVQVEVTGLTPGQPYHYRVRIVNSVCPTVNNIVVPVDGTTVAFNTPA